MFTACLHWLAGVAGLRKEMVALIQLDKHMTVVIATQALMIHRVLMAIAKYVVVLS